MPPLGLSNHAYMKWVRWDFIYLLGSHVCIEDKIATVQFWTNTTHHTHQEELHRNNLLLQMKKPTSQNLFHHDTIYCNSHIVRKASLRTEEYVEQISLTMITTLVAMTSRKGERKVKLSYHVIVNKAPILCNK